MNVSRHFPFHIGNVALANLFLPRFARLVKDLTPCRKANETTSISVDPILEIFKNLFPLDNPKTKWQRRTKEPFFPTLGTWMAWAFLPSWVAVFFYVILFSLPTANQRLMVFLPFLFTFQVVFFLFHALRNNISVAVSRSHAKEIGNAEDKSHADRSVTAGETKQQRQQQHQPLQQQQQQQQNDEEVAQIYFRAANESLKKKETATKKKHPIRLAESKRGGGR